MLMFRYFILLSLILAISAKTLNYKKIIYAIDCGNTQAYKSQTGVQYYPDRGYSDNTKVADYSTNSEIASAIIKYTYDQSVYMTERHADDTFYYDIPVNNPGKYVLISKFAENWHRTPKTRVFHIKIGDCMGEANVDIYDKVGRFAAYDSYIEFELKNNLIFVNGRPCDGAYVNGKLRVYYVKIGMDNPKVDGIMLFQGELAETDFDELPAMRRDWERRMKDEARRKEEDRLRKEEARLKRREKIKPRNDDFEGSGEDFEDMDYGNTRGGNIIDTLSDYLVLLIVIAVGAAIIYYVSAKGDAGSSWIDSIFGVDERPLLREERKEKKEKAPKVAPAAKAESATKTTSAAEGGQTKVESKKKKN